MIDSPGVIIFRPSFLKQPNALEYCGDTERGFQHCLFDVSTACQLGLFWSMHHLSGLVYQKYLQIVWSLSSAKQPVLSLASVLPTLTSLTTFFLIARAGLTTLSSRRQIEQAVFAFKFVHRIRLPDHLLDTLSHWTMNKPTRCASLRQADNIRLPRAKKAVLQRSPLYMSLSSWNALSADLKASVSSSTLRSSLTVTL